MHFLTSETSVYFTAGPVFHKALEIGVARERKNEGFDFYWRFRTRGDHAGLTFFVELFGWLFEFNIHDERHWDYENDTWERTPDELNAEYEAAKASRYDE